MGISQKLSTGSDAVPPHKTQGLSAKYLLFENVSNIISPAMRHVFLEVLRACIACGFTRFSWFTIGGDNLGSPQRRSRWYMLATHKRVSRAATTRFQQLCHGRKQLRANEKWNQGAKIALENSLQSSHSIDDVTRLKQLGNAVIPACCLAALEANLTTSG